MDYSRYERLIPFMDEESKRELADAVVSGRLPEFSRSRLKAWSFAAGAKALRDDDFWKGVKKCKT